jgi:hypothetical protein
MVQNEVRKSNGIKGKRQEGEMLIWKGGLVNSDIVIL